MIVMMNRTAKPFFVSANIAAAAQMPAGDLTEIGAWARLVHPEDWHSLWSAVTAALSGEVRNIEFRASAGKLAWRRFSAVFFPMADGAAAIGIDITREHALRERMARVDQVEMLGTLAGGIAHDFNNLLTAILGNLYLLDLELPAASPLRDYTGAASEAGAGGAALVRQLLDYSRPRDDPFEDVDFGEVVDATIRIAAAALRSIEVELRPCHEPVIVRGQSGALQQVLLNLVMNACDVMADGGTLTLACEHQPPGVGHSQAGDWWAIRVQDTGPGIPPADLPRIFDPFFTTKEAGKGTGLGLATVASIVRNHGGWIEVESSPATGTAFIIGLPAVAATVGPAVAALAAHVGESG